MRRPAEQTMLLDDYVHLVPFVEEPDYLFLKTIIPSRKATRDYLATRFVRGADPARGLDDVGTQAEADREGE